MRYGRNGGLALGLVLVTAAATLSPAAGNPRGGGGDAGAAPGQIVIKPTGRRVHVTAAGPARVRAAAKQSEVVHATVLVRPAVMSLTPTIAPRVRQSAMDQGLEFGEQSVRLPYGYDPRENACYGAGPFVHYPLYGGASVTPYYGGFGHGSAYGRAACDYGDYGIGLSDRWRR